MSASFPKANRVVDKKDFERVFSGAERIVTNILVLLYCTNSPACCRLGLAISKKHVAKAVERNRIKRQIREFFRHRKAECEGLDIVLVSRPAAVNADNRMLLRSLDELWRKLGARRCAA
jgi:ribonuclease P protein component